MFISKNEQVLDVQNKVQRVCVKMSDTGIVSTSGNNATIDVKETISEIRSAILVDDSAAALVVVPASGRTVSGTQVTLALGVAMTSADSIMLEYVIAD